MTEQKNVMIVFVCHNNKTVRDVLEKPVDSRVIFVGDQPVDDDIRNNHRVVIARELPNNIEVEKKLLTFTAWYLISKNNLFPEYDYLCILEYDVLFDKLVETILIEMTDKSNKDELDVIPFILCNGCFLLDVKAEVIESFIRNKGIESPEKYRYQLWFSTTNHCLRRSVLNEFVDWYYPASNEIKEKDYRKLSWYHERLFYIFIMYKNLKTARINGLTHCYKNSHHNGFASMGEL